MDPFGPIAHGSVMIKNLQLSWVHQRIGSSTA
jgi:hypothetical protein